MEMQAHKKYIREIADRPARFNNIVALALDAGLISGAIAVSMINRSAWVYLLSVVLIGSRMRALMNLLHESSHHCLATGNKWLNDLLAQLFCALPLLMTRHGYAESHMRHHLHFGNADKDPDLIRYRATFGEIAVHGARNLDEWMGAVLSVSNFVSYSYVNTVRSLLNAGPAEQWSLLAFWLPVVWLLASVGHLDLLLMYWIVPYLTSFKAICYVAELAEHFGLYAKGTEIEKTRNMRVNRIAAFIVWPHGDNFHLVHHLFPFVPGFYLSKVDAYLMSHSTRYASLRLDAGLEYSGQK